MGKKFTGIQVGQVHGKVRINGREVDPSEIETGADESGRVVNHSDLEEISGIQVGQVHGNVHWTW